VGLSAAADVNEIMFNRGSRERAVPSDTSLNPSMRRARQPASQLITSVSSNSHDKWPVGGAMTSYIASLCRTGLFWRLQASVSSTFDKSQRCHQDYTDCDARPRCIVTFQRLPSRIAFWTIRLVTFPNARCERAH
jgi:hypothetical protein